MAKAFLHLRAALAAALVFPFLASAAPVQAGEAAVAEFQRAAYAGDFEKGVANLDVMAQASPDDAEALFGRGALRVFAAFAHLQKGIYEHSTPTVSPLRNSMLLPFLGVWGQSLAGGPAGPAIANPNAKPMTYAILRQLITSFADELRAAEAALAEVGERPVKIPVAPFEIKFDLDHDGQISQHERIFASLLAAGSMQRRLDPKVVEDTITFDTADASWLRGYSNLFLASANLLLSLDFEKSYEAAAHLSFGADATAFGRFLVEQLKDSRPHEQVDAELKVLDDRLKELRQEQQALQPPPEKIQDLYRQMRELPRSPEADAQRAKIQDEINALNAPSRKNDDAIAALNVERNALSTERYGSSMDGIFDLVALVHTMNWEVIEPARMEAALQHLTRVMEINKQTWRLVRAETDDDHEWLPNPKQTPPFGAKPLTDEVIDSWLATTDLCAQILRGEKLLPHPRFVKGINLKKLLTTSKRIDVVMLIAGHDAVPFLEAGSIVDRKNWLTLTNPMGSQFATYAIWFN